MGINAQTSVPLFTAGEILLASQMGQINTGIPVFATTTTRDAAFGGTGEKVLAQGQLAYIEATNTTQYYTGTVWRTLVAGAWTLYTPTITANSGTFTSVSGSGYYFQVGTLVVATININIVTNGTAAGQVTFTLPVTADTSLTAGGSMGIGREANVTGNAINIWRLSTTLGNMSSMTNTYPGASGYNLCGTYSYQAA